MEKQRLATADSRTDVAMAVIDAVAVRCDCDALDLPVLHDAIDADALNAMVRSLDDDASLTFEYAGCEVSVTGAAHVAVTMDSEAVAATEQTPVQSLAD